MITGTSEGSVRQILQLALPALAGTCWVWVDHLLPVQEALAERKKKKEALAEGRARQNLRQRKSSSKGGPSQERHTGFSWLASPPAPAQPPSTPNPML